MKVIQYKCPNCGGELVFDPASGQHRCGYCKSVFHQEELDRQAAKETEAQPEIREEQDNTERADNTLEDARVYTCPSCGATIVTDATTAATFCYYCHNTVVLSGRLEGAYRPDYIIPFRIDRQQALETFRKWISHKRYVPREFYSEDQIEKFTGVYFPYLLYTCKIGGNVDGQGTRIRIYTRGGIEYTERSRFHVTRDGNMEVKHVLRNALQKADHALAENVLPFSMDEMQKFNMSYLSGFFAEKRDLSRQDFEAEVREEVRDYAREQLQESVADYSDLQITRDNTKLLDEKWEYALFPVWTMTYPYGGETFYFCINGQTGNPVGVLPMDKRKLFLTALCIFIPILLIALALFYFLF